MKPGNAIEVNNIKKRFKVYYDKGNSLKEKLLFWNRNRYENHWVLKGVSFEIKKGEVVGLIGKNGSGKSTTLKMLTKIMYPTEGSIEMTGRVSSLLELGAGFHPDMSGKENIFTNASIFGLTHAEIESRLDDIIRYSELEEFIDNPVRTYSSGMYMRLAFAVAINVDADILLIDEVLAVGDVNFQAKCFEKLQEIKRKGTTIVIVSHTMSQIVNICDRAIWVEDGVIKEDGDPQEIAKIYLGVMKGQRDERIEEEFQKELIERKNAVTSKKNKSNLNMTFCRKQAVREGSQRYVFTDAKILNSENNQTKFFKVGEELRFDFKYYSEFIGEKINVSINITREDGVYCFGTTLLSGVNGEYSYLSKNEGEISFKVKSNNFLEGKYLVDIGLQGMNEEKYDYISNCLSFRVLKSQDSQQGIVYLPCTWLTDGIEVEKSNY